MQKRQTAQYTVRSLPQSLDRRLRQTARENGKSRNKVVLEALQRASGLGDEPVEHHDLDPLVGSWKEDLETSTALLDQDKVDVEIWK